MGYKHYKLLVCDEKSNNAENITIHTEEGKTEEEILRRFAKKYPDKGLKLYEIKDNKEEVFVKEYGPDDTI